MNIFNSIYNQVLKEEEKSPSDIYNTPQSNEARAEAFLVQLEKDLYTRSVTIWSDKYPKAHAKAISGIYTMFSRLSGIKNYSDMIKYYNKLKDAFNNPQEIIGMMKDEGVSIDDILDISYILLKQPMKQETFNEVFKLLKNNKSATTPPPKSPVAPNPQPKPQEQQQQKQNVGAGGMTAREIMGKPYPSTPNELKNRGKKGEKIFEVKNDKLIEHISPNPPIKCSKIYYDALIKAFVKSQKMHETDKSYPYPEIMDLSSLVSHELDPQAQKHPVNSSYYLRSCLRLWISNDLINRFRNREYNINKKYKTDFEYRATALWEKLKRDKFIPGYGWEGEQGTNPTGSA